MVACRASHKVGLFAFAKAHYLEYDDLLVLDLDEHDGLFQSE